MFSDRSGQSRAAAPRKAHAGAGTGLWQEALLTDLPERSASGNRFMGKR